MPILPPPFKLPVGLTVGFDAGLASFGFAAPKRLFAMAYCTSRSALVVIVGSYLRIEKLKSAASEPELAPASRCPERKTKLVVVFVP